MLPARLNNEHPLAQEFRNFIEQPSFPCLGAKSALCRRQLTFVVARDVTSAWDDLKIYPALYNFASGYRPRRRLFQSFVVLFEEPGTLNEMQFEHAMWQRIQSLTDKDVWHGQRSDPTVSNNPASPHFSLSFAGEAFFAVGLHPKASRPARRFFVPAIVFNLHDQFEEMRKTSTYVKLHDKIIERDIKLAGDANPMLQSFGAGSEARQYSGRIVDKTWACPFSRKSK